MMQRLNTSAAAPRAPRVCFLCVVVFLSAVASSTPALAQTQDAAESARQERARKNSHPNKSTHVYTEQDLKRSRILTPEDRDRVQSAKKNSTPEQPPTDPASLDAQSGTATTPLGDVARKYRAEKSARETEQALRKQPASGFHLGLSATALAAPKPLASLKSVAPPRLPATRGPEIRLWSPMNSAAPSAPRGPFIVKRVSPFQARPLAAAPHAPVMAMPSAPAAPSASARPAAPLADILRSAPRPNRRPHSSASAIAPHLAPRLSVMPSSAVPAPMEPSAPLQPRPALQPAISSAHTITVQGGDSLWKLAGIYLGSGNNWKLLAAANSAIVDPNRIIAGQLLIVPTVTASASQPESAARKIVVRSGDSLWKLARTHLGHGAAWTCLAQSNSAVADPARITIGQILTVPASCISRP